MSHFARIDENNVVVSVIVAEQDFIDLLPDKESWIQTSYNTINGIHYNQNGEPSGQPQFRGNFAAIGSIYVQEIDAFVKPKPYESWVFNSEKFIYEPPKPRPINEPDIFYIWDEDSIDWLKFK